MAITPNMNLDLPTPGTGGTPGPEWASDINTALEDVDEHDHTSGSGVAVPSAGLNINGDLPFNGNNVTGVRTLRLDNQVSTPATADDVRVVYSKNGELTYRDASGNEVAITSAGSVAGATGSISGLSSPASAVYSSLTGTFSWLYDTAKAARMASGDLTLYAYDGSTAFTETITIKVPTALASTYSVTLPLAAPSVTYPVTMSSAGVLAASGTVGLADGSAGSPSLMFAADTDNGFYRIGSDSVGLSLGGTLRVTYTTAGVQLVDGSASAPSYSFASDTNTGLFRTGADSIGFATNGVNRMSLGTTALSNDLVYYAPNGSASLPAYAFSSDTDLGIYRVSSNVLGVGVNGTSVAQFSSSGASLDAGSTFFKCKTFTGTLAASTNVDLSITGTVISAFGWMPVIGGTIEPASASTTSRIQFIDSSSSSTVRIRNQSAGVSRAYGVVVFYS